MIKKVKPLSANDEFVHRSSLDVIIGIFASPWCCLHLLPLASSACPWRSSSSQRATDR